MTSSMKNVPKSRRADNFAQLGERPKRIKNGPAVQGPRKMSDIIRGMFQLELQFEEKEVRE